MKKLKIILYPLIVFASVFVAVAITMILHLNPRDFGPWLFIFIVNSLALVFITNLANPTTTKQALKYGAAWLVIIFILDATITYSIVGRVETIAYFSSFKTWVSYVIILIIPVVWANKNVLIKK